jgi:benzoyl-CoA 2,3-epoxidase subunit A
MNDGMVLQSRSRRHVRLCDLPLRASVQVIGPSGATFLMPDDPECTLLMICTGTGIVPMRAMVERRKRLGQLSRGRILLFYGGRTLQEMAYFDELAALASSRMRFYYALSR